MGRLSQAISEGDGISILVEVSDRSGARVAEEQGAEGLVLRDAADGLREVSALPLLWLGVLADAYAIDVDAVVIDLHDQGDRLAAAVDAAGEVGFECVLRVRDEDDLERALEQFDPEILLLTAEEAENGHELERLLELLPEVPAGKLAIAELAGASADDVAELERAGVDAVLVTAGDVGALVGESPPQV
jgi:hypothetical protein